MGVFLVEPPSRYQQRIKDEVIVSFLGYCHIPENYRGGNTVTPCMLLCCEYPRMHGQVPTRMQG